MAQAYNPLLQQRDEGYALALQRAQMPQQQRRALDAELAGQETVAGVSDIGRGMLGLPSSDRSNRSAASAEIRALAQTTAPGTPEFYKAAATIFQKYGMAAEAERMQQMLVESEYGPGGPPDVVKWQRALEAYEKRLAEGDQSVKPAIDAIRQRMSTFGQQGTPPTDPEFIRLLNAHEAAVKAGDTERAAMIKKAIDAWLTNKAKTGADMTEYQRQRLELDKKKFEADRKDKDQKAADAKTAMVNGLNTLIRIVSEQLQVAEGLLTHPGLPYIVGKWVGLAGRVPAAFSDDAAGAQALYKRVEAVSFLSALNELRATSKGGATGLGQLTEREGDKIQSAKAALDRQQPVEQFKEELGRYIASLREMRGANAKDLTQAGAPVPAELPKIVHKQKPKLPKPGAAAPQPDAAPAPDKPKSKYRSEKVG